MRIKCFGLMLGCLGLLLIVGCRQEYLMAGKTMGTTYHIKVVAGPLKSMDRVQEKIDDRLQQINRSMSTFQPDSEISRFNALTEPGAAFIVSPDFMNVMTVAQQIYHLTQGAWDATVNPLINLWGFGKDGTVNQIPSVQAVAAALDKVGFDQIGILGDDRLIKKNGQVSIDLASIAKGYGVDQVANLLKELGFNNFLVEIGGEVFAAGVRSDGKAWRVGINQPNPDAAADDIYAVLALTDKAMATSGDYRNFYRIGERFYSHIIDPRTGHPVQNRVVSTSVIADNCTLADGLATALMVMGPDKGVALLDSLPAVQGVIIMRHADGLLENFPSAGLEAFIE